MRTEAEIKAAIELVQSCKPKDNFGIQNRDCTAEALRYALGIDDEDSSPMGMTLADLIQDMKDNPHEHGIQTGDASFSE